MKVIGYVRVSTKKQENNFSLESQRKEIEKYCIENNLTLVNILTDIESGFSIKKRNGLQEILLNLKDIDGLIVYDLDRLSRNLIDNLEIFKLFNKSNKNLFIINDNFRLDSNYKDPNDIFLNNMKMLVNEYERNKIKQRMMNGKATKKALGGFVGGSPKFGKMIKHTVQIKDNKTFIIKELIDNDKEMGLIKLIKNHKKSGKSLYQIMNYLNDKGYKTKRGSQFTITSIKRILENEKSNK